MYLTDMNLPTALKIHSSFKCLFHHNFFLKNNTNSSVNDLLNVGMKGNCECTN